MALTKLITDLIDGSLGTDWQTTPKTANFTAIAGEGYFVDTTSAAITVTLPSSPTASDEVNLVDYAGTADTNNITITSSNNINGASDDKVINYERGGVSMVYVDATQGWIAYNAANETAEALNTPLTVEYLVVAGGGASNRYNGGGGGAGGLRTSFGSTSGGGASAETSLSLATATNYTVTVGGGGTQNDATAPTSANDGINSVFSTITSIGGGAGGVRTSNASGVARDGGSGGGGGSFSSGGYLAGSGTSGQGYDGANGADGGSYQGGGGGGAAAVGTRPNGGAGLAVNILNSTNAGTASVGEISSSDVYYSGGGGAGANSSAGSGGIGGGGDGQSSYTMVSGDPNTGGGGGGGAMSGTISGGNGGAGVVILRYPSSYSITVGSGIVEASGSLFTEGLDKVSVFTGGTGNISFS